MYSFNFLPNRGLLAVLTLTLGWIFGSSEARSEDWIIMGPRAMGMGGAGVATYHGGYGLYWNPASLGMAPYRHSDEEEVSEEEETQELTEKEEESEESSEEPRAPIPLFDFAIHSAVNVEDTGDTINTIFEIQELVEALDFPTLESKFQSGTPFTTQEVQSALELLNQIPELQDRGEGLLIHAANGLGFRFSRLGLSFNALGFAGAEPVVDLLQNISLGNQGIDQVLSGLPVPGSGQLTTESQNLVTQLVGTGFITTTDAQRLVFQAQNAGVNTADPEFQQAVVNVLQATDAADGGSLQTIITNNQTGTSLRGAMVGEAAIGYAQPFGEFLSIGISAKAMLGTTYQQSFTLSELGTQDNFFDELISENNREETFDWGIDVGVLFRPVEWLVLGVTGKNLNQPEFDFADGTTFALDPQGRAGISIMPFDWLTLAADVDLTTNHSDIIPGYESQHLGGGAEINLFNFLYLRAGLSKNLKRSDNDLYLHAGVAARIWVLSIDAGAVIPADFEDLDEVSNLYDKVENLEDVPSRVGASVMIGVNIPF